MQITPFNMKEEMEEGHFDKNGMYIFDKDKVEHRRLDVASNIRYILTWASVKFVLSSFQNTKPSRPVSIATLY